MCFSGGKVKTGEIVRVGVAGVVVRPIKIPKRTITIYNPFKKLKHFFDAAQRIQERVREITEQKEQDICPSCLRPIRGDVYPGGVCFSCFRAVDP